MGLSLGWRTFALERKHASVILARSNWVVLDSGTEGDHRPVSTSRRLPSEKTVRMGDKAKPLAAYRRRLCCLCGCGAIQYKISKIKLSISMIAVTPATESTNASLASW